MRPIDADKSDEIIVFDKQNELIQCSAIVDYCKRQREFLNKFPTIDVELVRHGHWINAYPDLIEALKSHQKNGDKLILWTCRCGEYLDKAVEWCKEQGLIFDAVNENVPDIIKRHTLSIDEYGFAWDDPMWFKAEICEDCLKKIMEEVKDGNCR